jgi:hypothetical protein
MVIPSSDVDGGSYCSRRYSRNPKRTGMIADSTIRSGHTINATFRAINFLLPHLITFSRRER